MILQTVEPSPSQMAAFEKMAGRKLQERENNTQQMRHQLYLLDRSERRMSIEECAAALLEKTA